MNERFFVLLHNIFHCLCQRQKQAEQMPLGASANTMNQLQLQHSPEMGFVPSDAGAAASQAIPIAGSPGGQTPHTRYRRNSYTQAFDSPPSPPRSQPPPRRPANTNPAPNVLQANQPPPAAATGRPAQPRSGSQQSQAPLSQSVPRSAFIGPGGGGMSTLESARRIAAGDPERIRALQDSSSPSQGVGTPRLRGSASVQERSLSPRDGSSTMDIIRAHSHHGGVSKVAPQQNSHHSTDPVTYSEPYGHHPAPGAGPTRPELRDSDATEVKKWINPHNGGMDVDPRRGPPPQYPHHLKQQRQAQQTHNTYYSSDEDDE